jgi:hypothetical protein
MDVKFGNHPIINVPCVVLSQNGMYCSTQVFICIKDVPDLLSKIVNVLLLEKIHLGE